MSKKDENLEKLIENQSFKIKPIYIELQNYSYYHSAISENDDDSNNRFVGRKKVIDKIRSFIFESTQNTGTFLISGFRGMGKTSIMNKALSNLNPKPKFKNYVILWLLILPFILHPDLFEIQGSSLLKVLLFFAVIIFVIYQFYESTNMIKTKLGASFSIRNFTLFFFDLFNPGLHRDKFTLIKNFRNALIYIFVLLIYKNFIHTHCNGNCSSYSEIDMANLEHTNLIGLSLFIISIYFFIDLFKDILNFYNKVSRTERNNFEVKKWILLAFKSIFLLSFVSLFSYGFFAFLYEESTYGHFYEMILNNLSFTKNGLFNKLTILIFGLFFFKLLFKVYFINKENIKYKTPISRLISFLDLKEYLIVKINLGKDDLSEKDVLKYIANEITKTYSSWYYNLKNFKRLFHVIGVNFFLFILLNFIYESIDKDYLYNTTNITFGLAQFFPSQAFLERDDESLIIDINSYKRYVSEIKKLERIELQNIKFGFESIRYNNKILTDEIHFKENVINCNNNFNNIKLELIDDPSILNKVLYNIGKVTNFFDYIFTSSYLNIRMMVLGADVDSSKSTLVKFTVKHVFPKAPSLFIFLALILLFALSRILPTKLLPFDSHSNILRELKHLLNEIDASITKEENTNSGNYSFFNFKKSASFKPLESKDITQRLIHILEKIDSTSIFHIKLKFILIFDELDKISSFYNSSISNKEDEFEQNDQVRFQAKRKERIASILSSMKHFLNTAKVKSFFITGREMYDAALAGISDRESSLDSIFSDNKIYIRSFYTEGEDNNLTDITSMTEYYVCQFIIPKDYLLGRKPCLKVYNEYLKEMSKNSQDSKYSDKRIKTISTLKDFVNYLTYRSNGAPRKISGIFEQYIKPYTTSELQKPDNLIFGNNSNNMYLKFSYYDQYKFSFVSYLVTPIFLRLGNHMSDYSDKLLVSISYMLDHLFKHHKIGLSYRSLSLTPEIIDVNKEPEFRNFLDKFIDFLSKNHLRKIVSGVYDYKFQSKISAELKYLSKVNELEAAAFNFTLDESIELKRFFHKKINFLQKQYKGQSITINSKKSSVVFKNSISFIQMQLGDLHFNDEEFGDAIEHYLEALQSLRQKDIKEMNLYEFIVYVRNKLKLGLAFEKNKMYDSAEMTYSELTDFILNKRNIPIRKIGLARFILNVEKVRDLIISNEALIYKILDIEEELSNIDLEAKIKSSYFKNVTEISIIGRPNKALLKKFNKSSDWKKVWNFDDMECFYDFDGHYILNNYSDLGINYKPLKKNYEFSTNENIRILYQPIIAKLHVIEKASANSLKDVDMVRAIKEFNFFIRPLQTEQKQVIVAEFYNKLGDIMYFKNGTINSNFKSFVLSKFMDAECLNDDKCKNEDNPNLICSNCKIKNDSKILLSSPIDATMFYLKSLETLLLVKDPTRTISFEDYYDNLKFDDFFEKASRIFDQIEIELLNLKTKDSFRSKYSNSYLVSVANGIIDLAGSLLIFADKENSIFINITLKRCIKLYYTASLIYKRIGEYRLAKSQVIKILQILISKNDNNNNAYEFSFDDNKDSNNKISTVEKLVNLAIEYVFKTHNQSTRPEINKIRLIFKDYENFSAVYKGTSIMAEIQEIIILYWSLFAKSTLNNNNNYPFEAPIIFNSPYIEEVDIIKLFKFSLCNISPFSSINKKFNRVMELNLRLRTNKLIYRRLKDNKIRYKFYFKSSNELSTKEYIKDYFLNEADENKFKIDIRSLYTKTTEETEIMKIMQLFDNISVRNLDVDTVCNFLIVDSIGACNEIIKSHDLFDIDYVTTTHLSYAKAHAKMAFWCREARLDKYGNDKDAEGNMYREINKDLKKNIEKILYSENLMYISPDYHNDLALEYNYKLKNFHKRGTVLIDFLQNNSYLDDFYNDNLVHFAIALERNNMHEHFEKKIKSLKEDSKSQDNIYDIDNYQSS